MTLIARCTGDWIGANAAPRLTSVSLRAGVTIVTCAAVRFRWVRTQTGCRITRSRVVTLIARRARDWIGTSADSRLTRISLRTGVAIITHGAVLLRWIRARSALRIAGAGVVTLITRGT